MGHDDLYQQAIDYYAAMAREKPRECLLELYKVAWTWKGRAVLVPLNIIGGLVMARGKQGAKQNGAVKATWNTTFVDIPLTGYTWEQISEQWGVPEEVVELATSLLEDGYRLGFSYNPQNDAFICSVTCKAEESVNNGCTFTAFAGSWFEALVAALFKHYVVAQEQWRSVGGSVSKASFG